MESQKRPADLQKRPTKEPYKRDLQKRPTKKTGICNKRPANETYKRDLQKRPTKETYKERAKKKIACCIQNDLYTAGPRRALALISSHM